MLETLLKENGTELLAALTGSGGLDTSQAELLLSTFRFVKYTIIT